MVEDRESSSLTTVASSITYAGRDCSGGHPVKSIHKLGLASLLCPLLPLALLMTLLIVNASISSPDGPIYQFRGVNVIMMG